MSSTQLIWCLGSAKFVKEIAPLIEHVARVRWVADESVLGRLLATSTCGTVITEHTTDSQAVDRLQQVRLVLPRTRRLVVMPSLDLKAVRDYLESEAATELVYRPLEQASLLRSCGLTPLKAKALSHV